MLLVRQVSFDLVYSRSSLIVRRCWSNYLGRLPQLPLSITTVPKFDVFPGEESDIWTAYTDSGVNQSHAQPSRTRAVALQISALCEISGDLMSHFYNPIDLDKSKGKQTELKKLSDIHQRLEAWRRALPQELEPKEGGLPSMLVMQCVFIHCLIYAFTDARTACFSSCYISIFSGLF